MEIIDKSTTKSETFKCELSPFFLLVLEQSLCRLPPMIVLNDKPLLRKYHTVRTIVLTSSDDTVLNNKPLLKKYRTVRTIVVLTSSNDTFLNNKPLLKKYPTVKTIPQSNWES